jgi:hypothetical protein
LSYGAFEPPAQDEDEEKRKVKRMTERLKRKNDRVESEKE